jgi:hypothetical protein
MILPRLELRFVGLAIQGLTVTRTEGFLARVQSDSPAGGGHLSGNPTYRELREESSGTVTIDSIPFTKNSAIIYKQEKAFRKFTSFC